MSARVVDGRLAVEFVFSNGTRYSLELEQLPCSRLVRDLGCGLAAMAHPHGDIDAAGTVQQYGAAIARLSRVMAEVGFTGGAGELSKARLVEFWLAQPPYLGQHVRLLLRSLDKVQEGLLRPDVARYLTGPALRTRPRPKPLSPYSSGEWKRLRDCCEAIVEDAITDQRRALAEAELGQDPRTGGWTVHENQLWLLRSRGPMNAAEVADHLGWSMRRVQRLTSPSVAGRRLYPTLRVVLAFRLLLGMATGIVPDGLDDLGLQDVDWAGDATVLLEYVKGRTRRESLNLPPEAVRLLRRWLEYSAPLRSFASERVRAALWLAYQVHGSPRIARPSMPRSTVRAWAREKALVGDDGLPMPVHRHRIRTTFEHRRDKSAWTGRATIDPNHSAKVEGEHYLAPVTPSQVAALATVVEGAQADLVRKAHAPIVLPSDAARDAAVHLPERIAHLALTDDVVRELVGGQRDVFTAACGDQLAGLHGPRGRPCPARPWVCLLCPLAVFAPRHAANLLRLKAFFARQFRQMTVPQFLAVFGPYAQRLDSDILPKFAPAVLAAAATEVGDRDDELPLRPEEATS